jgi:hypothetical protein
VKKSSSVDDEMLMAAETSQQSSGISGQKIHDRLAPSMLMWEECCLRCFSLLFAVVCDVACCACCEVTKRSPHLGWKAEVPLKHPC